MTHDLWQRHPHVDTEGLSRGERAADRMRNSMGSWAFVGWALLILAAWIVSVTVLHWPIDNPQLTILNLLLSCFAALQGAIILLAAKRADTISAQLATAHYGETSAIDELIKSNTKLTEQVHELLRQNTTLTEQVAALLGATPSEGTKP